MLDSHVIEKKAVKQEHSNKKRNVWNIRSKIEDINPTITNYVKSGRVNKLIKTTR